MEDGENAVPNPQVGPARVRPLPSGAGVTLDERPSVARQFAFSALLGFFLSAGAVSQWWRLELATSPLGLATTFFVTLAIFWVVWLAVLGFRTLDRRRLLRRFPGTLVFSSRQTSELVNALIRLGAFEPGRRDFDFGSVEVVADLRGLTFWQRNPPELYASLPWDDVDSVRVGRQSQPRGRRAAWTVDFTARSGDEVVEGSMFDVDGSIMPLPTRREVEWVQQQLERLRAHGNPDSRA